MIKQANTHSKAKQKGAALLVFAIIVLTISSAVFLYSTNESVDTRLLNTHKTQLALSEAKKTLEQISLTFTPNPFNPNPSNPTSILVRNEIGRLPFPDNRLDGAYDGLADCQNPGIPVANPDSFLGRFPWLGTQNCSPEININQDLKDANGEQLWYAVSPNMVENIANAGFSPAFLNNSPPRPNWLSIYNADGTLISDRIAFIVFSAGVQIAGQRRLNTHPRNFLDAVTVPGLGSINNYDNDLIFVKGPRTETFNDQLSYMTIDELMPKLERRVLLELKSLLNQYRIDHDFYPLPASLGTTDCDILLKNGGGGFIATTNLLTAPCNPSLLPVPTYLESWLPYVIYEPRRDCNQTLQSGCNNLAAGLTLNNQTNIDFILLSTGFNSPVDAADRTEYLEDAINQIPDQTFVTPAVNPTIFQDQLIYR